MLQRGTANARYWFIQEASLWFLAIDALYLHQTVFNKRPTSLRRQIKLNIVSTLDNAFVYSLDLLLLFPHFHLTKLNIFLFLCLRKDRLHWMRIFHGTAGIEVLGP